MGKIYGLIAVLIVVAACAGTGATLAPTIGPTASAGASQTGATVSVGTTSLGSVLVGPNGHTLYGFTPDQAAGKPTCNSPCSTTWPPLTVTGDFTVGSGLDKANFKLVARDDGSMQLETGGFPLYEFAPDVNSGDTNGQGVGGKWFAMGSNGQRIGAPSASASVAASPSAATSPSMGGASPTPASTY